MSQDIILESFSSEVHFLLYFTIRSAPPEAILRPLWTIWKALGGMLKPLEEHLAKEGLYMSKITAENAAETP